MSLTIIRCNEKCLILILFSFILSCQSTNRRGSGKPLILDKKSYFEIPTEPHIQVYQANNIEEVDVLFKTPQKLNEIDFKELNKSELQWRGHYIFRIPIESKQENTIEANLFLDTRVSTADSRLLVWHTGSMKDVYQEVTAYDPNRKTPFLWHNFKVQPGRSILYVSPDSDYFLSPPKILSNDRLWHSIDRRSNLYHSIYSSFLVLFLYNLAMYFMHKKSDYLLLLGYAASAAISNWALCGGLSKTFSHFIEGSEYIQADLTSFFPRS